MTKFKTDAEIVAEVNKEFEGDLNAIRRDESRTGAWKRAQIAQVYQRIRQERARRMEERNARQRSAQRGLEAALFGKDATVADAGSWAISRRDAGDRAAKLEQEDEARVLLKRAERSNDEPLARAIAERAYEMGWVDATNDFLESRPHLDAQMNELWAQRPQSMRDQLMELITVQLAPAELQGLTDPEIDAVAAQAPAEAAASA